MGFKLTRCAFAVILKFSGLIHILENLLEFVDEINTMPEEDL